MINQTVIELDSCEETYEDINEVSDTVFCSTIVNSNQPNGACQGDSGGPVVANNKLQGLVSWGLDCEEKGFPDVNTNVYLFNDWINQHINK
ncbi:unnamed protein product [Leptosia nina]|uniref:Peptidase S1 domain-containing protein n=1 Tax=Leptosia nina TaxID=320188 RepID=A0AAV1JJB0_9NEOP